MQRLIRRLALVTVVLSAHAFGAQEVQPVSIQIEFKALKVMGTVSELLRNLEAELVGFGIVDEGHHEIDSPVRFVTDEHGLAHVDFEVTPALYERWFAENPSVIVRVRGSRFTYQELTVALNAHDESPYTGVIHPFTGGTLRGRVVNLSGSTNRAYVRLSFPRSYTAAKTAVMDDGKFEIHYRARGQYRLEATYSGPRYQQDEATPPAGSRDDHRQLGAAAPETIKLLGGLFAEELLVVLGGAGVITGRVTDSHGKPVVNVGLRAKWRSCWATDVAADRAGLKESSCKTNSRGEFSFVGLRKGNFEVTYTGGRNYETLRSIDVRSDASPLELTCDIYRVLVSIDDSDGKPFRLTDRSWNDEVRIELTDLGTGKLVHITLDGSNVSALFTAPDYQLTLSVEPDRDYLLVVRPMSGPLMSRKIRCSADNSVERIKSQLPALQDLGALEIALAKRYPIESRHRYNFQVKRRGDHVALNAEPPPGRNVCAPLPELAKRYLLEPGEHTVTITTSMWNWEQTGGRSQLRPVRMFDHQQVVRIEKGKTTRFVLPFPTEGRVSLDIYRGVARKPGDGPSVPHIRLTSLATSLEFPVEWIAGEHEKDRELFGLGESRVASEPFPPGAYEIEVSVSGLKTTRQKFRVEPGELTKLSIELKP